MTESATLRLMLTLAYDGTFFRGWAAQPGLRTCQGVIESALATIARHPLRLTVAGRTDAGVHAAHQVAHVDFPVSVWHTLVRTPRPTPTDVACQALTRRLNSLLARSYGQWMRERGLEAPTGTSDLVITATRAVSADFDARFSALGRAYTYRVTTGTPQPRNRHDVYAVPGPLDIAAMNEAAAALLGEHDFLAFCKPREGATAIRTLRRLDVHAVGNIVEFHVEADAFCHSMVRSLVGALLDVGHGRDVTWPAQLLAAASRTQAAPLAPAHGLSLEGITYPPEDQWAAQAARARRRRDEVQPADTQPAGAQPEGAQPADAQPAEDAQPAGAQPTATGSVPVRNAQPQRHQSHTGEAQATNPDAGCCE